MKILLADDDKDALAATAALLSQRGDSVDVAFDGREALARIKTNSYDLIIVDHNMPGLSGLDLIKYVKENALKAKTVMLTAYPALDDFLVKAVGADEYVEKAKGLEEIERIVTKYGESSAE